MPKITTPGTSPGRRDPAPAPRAMTGGQNRSSTPAPQISEGIVSPIDAAGKYFGKPQASVLTVDFDVPMSAGSLNKESTDNTATSTHQPADTNTRSASPTKRRRTFIQVEGEANSIDTTPNPQSTLNVKSQGEMWCRAFIEAFAGGIITPTQVKGKLVDNREASAKSS
ncbi:hypothetical protein FRB90_007067 [Tulasnella sp. 427]|nr:hypothetical protein FRB90_007067 [Tulasnella sp. 427]